MQDRWPLVVLTAFACDPRAGSEPGAGWLAVQTAAELAERLVVLIGEGEADVVTAAASALPARVEVVKVPLPVPEDARVYVRYLWWLWRTARHLASMSESGERVDVVHHVTYASDWLPAPFALTSKRYRTVWGPVGGNTYPPLAALRHLSRPAAAKDVVRRLLTSSVRRGTALVMRGRTDAALALNEDTQAFTRTLAPSEVHPNSAWEELPARAPSSAPAEEARGPRTALYAGRLLEWKGAVIAVHAVRATATPWQLVVLGDGPAEAAMRDAAGAGPVRFLGRVSRAESMAAMASADALVLPSLHDSAPWVAAEAAAAGLPVVCLDLGGVAGLAGRNAVPVAVRPTGTLVQRLAAALDELVPAAHTPVSTWTRATYRAAFARAYGLAVPER